MLLNKSGHAAGEHEEDAAIVSYEITGDTDNSIEYALLTPPK